MKLEFFLFSNLIPNVLWQKMTVSFAFNTKFIAEISYTYLVCDAAWQPINCSIKTVGAISSFPEK